MLTDTAELIQQSDLANLLRNSFWLYPLINTGHIFGFSVLIGSILTLDLKLLGVWPTVALKDLVKVLRPVAISGLTLAIVCGLLLFYTRPIDYLSSTIFILKLMLLSAAILNILVLSFSVVWREAVTNNVWGKRIKIQAALSLVLWIAILFFGRLIGYR